MSTNKIKTILVADDDPDILSMLSVRLQTIGYQILEASDGEQALELALQHNPDLLILDVMMPGKSGWEVARELRKDTKLSNIKILMLTAIGEQMNQITAPLYGANDYLDKPFDFNQLENKIATLLS